MSDAGDLAPFYVFESSTWATFRHSSDVLTLTEDELKNLAAFNDRISLDEVARIYQPLSRLLYLNYRSRHNRMSTIRKFLGRDMAQAPFIISISGSVSVGKTTTARLLDRLIKAWPNHPRVSLITTDGFLYPNAVLEERMLSGRKGFPISYDVEKLMQFLYDVRDGKPALKVPVYSHLTYDVVPGEYTLVDCPDVLIIEGVNVLQTGADYPLIRNRVFISDFVDFSIYVDAEEHLLLKWYTERFLRLRESTFDDPTSYFHKYANIPEDQAVALAKLIWEAVNHVNLVENILPCRDRASVILHKGEAHHIDRVALRK